MNKSDIRPDAAIELDKIVKVMNDNPEMIIELGSHTDCRGSSKSNQILSDKRAKASAKYIQERITNPERISGKGYGESKLVNRCSDGVDCSEVEHQENRRTEFIIIQMKEPAVQEDLPENVENETYITVIGKEHKDSVNKDLGEYKGFSDYKTILNGDSVYIYTGEYTDFQEAMEAKEGLEDSGVRVELNEKSSLGSGKLYRIQLGAFKKLVDLKYSFRDIKDVYYETGKDGLFHYYTGSFETLAEAKEYKKMLGEQKGYNEAFVVSYSKN